MFIQTIMSMILVVKLADCVSIYVGSGTGIRCSRAASRSAKAWWICMLVL